MSNPIELQSLEQINEMNAERQKAIDALKISDNTVKCQRCGNTDKEIRCNTISCIIRMIIIISTAQARLRYC